MATVAELTTVLSEINSDLDRIIALVADLHNNQGIPEADLDPILTAANEAKAKAASIV